MAIGWFRMPSVWVAKVAQCVWVNQVGQGAVAKATRLIKVTGVATVGYSGLDTEGTGWFG